MTLLVAFQFSKMGLTTFLAQLFSILRAKLLGKNIAFKFLSTFFQNVHFSSNVNEAIRAILNFFVFFTKRFYTNKKHKTHIGKQKFKKAAFLCAQKPSKGKKVIRLFALCAFNTFCAFAWLLLCAFGAFYAFCAFCACIIFS